MDDSGSDERDAPRRWVTSAEVARKASVSRAAVSRAFTPGASVAPETRRRILAAAEAVGYRPNAIARTLNTRRSGIVGVVITEIANPFYARLLDALGTALQARGMLPLVSVAPDPQETDELLARLLSYQVDGVVVASAMLSSEIAARCKVARTPLVMVDRHAAVEGAAVVGADNAGGGALVADLFVASGNRRPAFVAGISETSTSHDREAGFVARLADHGLALVARDVGGFTYGGGRAAADRLLSRPDRPDAIFCANDEMALGVMDTARSGYSLQVPGDLSVVGFDNTPPAALDAYGLTTVAQDIEKLATAAIDLLQAPQGPKRGETGQLRIPCRLVLRRSTRLPEVPSTAYRADEPGPDLLNRDRRRSRRSARR